MSTEEAHSAKMIRTSLFTIAIPKGFVPVDEAPSEEEKTFIFRPFNLFFFLSLFSFWGVPLKFNEL